MDETVVEETDSPAQMSAVQQVALSFAVSAASAVGCFAGMAVVALGVQAYEKVRSRRSAKNSPIVHES